jgi:hypothetical protein
MMKFTKITAAAFGVIAVLHLVRAALVPDLASYLPVWGSMLLAALLASLAAAQLLYRSSIPCTTWEHTCGYSLTVAVLLAGAAIHTYRAFADPQLFLRVPVWPSWIGIVVASYLSWHNWRK